MQAIILAGGKGTRMAAVSRTTPKALLPVAGKPVLEYQIDLLRHSGISDVTVVIGHLGGMIRDWLGDGQRYGMRVSYFEEATPLGTGGALAELSDQLRESFIVMYGDLMVDMDIARLLRFHRERRAICTLTVHANTHPADSDVVVLNPSAMVERFLYKNTPRSACYRNLVNAGVLACEPELLSFAGRPGTLDLERDIVAPAISSRRVYGYRTTEYIHDMGTVARYARVQADAAAGVMRKRNLQRKQKAVFLDRDGTILKLVELLNHPDQVQLQDDAVSAIKALNQSEYLCIVVTNQPVVARNLCTIESLEEIHRCMETRLAEGGVYVDEIYYCPHHPDGGYAGENRAFKVTCRCRKPGTLLLERAAAAFNVDLSSSYFIGDSTVDIETGKSANMRTILVATGLGGRDGRYKAVPDHRVGRLSEAVSLVTGGDE
jgi:histidinol-phosphate phosphatase family protein